MIKKVIFGLFLLGVIPVFNTEIKAQTYVTESKSCGNCGKEVSIHSKIGDYCPHCGVRWGYENEKRINRKTGMVYSTANLRSQPSTKSRIITKIPAYTSVNIISRRGAWYYVSVEVSEGYYTETYEGYLHNSVLH